MATAGAASAHPVPVPKATGSIALAHPTQYVSFVAQAGPGRYHGWIDYANFMYKAPFAHTNVWNIGGTHQLVFTVGSSTYAHTMYVTSITPVSTTATSFSGTGTYNPDPANYTWTVSGTVSYNQVSFTITYTGKADPGYSLTATGVIARDGSVSGTATDSNKLTLPFTMPAGSAFQVLRFQAPVTWAIISRHDAIFGFTVPRMPVRLAGLHMMAKVHDGGPGYKYDTYAQGVAFWGYFGRVLHFPITSGDILVRR